MAFDPWSLMFLLPWLTKLLFPGEAGTTGTAATEQLTETEADYPHYRSPSLGLLDPTLLKGLLGNVQLFQGAGMPGGMGDVGIGGMTQDIFKLLEEQWPEIMEEYRTGGTPDYTEGGKKISDAKSCKESCTERTQMTTGEDYQNCFNECMSAKGHDITKKYGTGGR